MGRLFTEVATFTAQIRHHELFNFMLSNREILFAHANTLLYYIIRIIITSSVSSVPPFGDNDVTVDFAAATTPATA